MIEISNRKTFTLKNKSDHPHKESAEFELRIQMNSAEFGLR